MDSSIRNIITRSWPVILMVTSLVIWLVIKDDQFDYRKSENTPDYISLNSSKESCFQCHEGTTGYAQFHDPNAIGCVSCHLGDAKSKDKESAHFGMVLIPGDLSNAEVTCGVCHPKELHKIQHSLMTTNSGLVAVDKYVFGETNSPDMHFDIRDLGYNGVDEHLRNLCANCHLGAKKTEFGPITQLSRGGGCNACHLNYSKTAGTQLQDYLDSNREKLPVVHPSTDILMTDEHCFGCHSRSSRISSNYMGWHETLLDEKEVIDTTVYKVFEDKRVYEFKGEDVHHAKGLLCIDCHSSHEVMGDGKNYLHEEDAVSLSCSDCHVKDKPLTIDYNDLDEESKLVFMHRNYTHSDKKILRVLKDQHPLVNTYVEDGEIYLIGKKNGEKHLIKKQGETCRRDQAHTSLSCASCHSQWAPRCIGCHNTYDQKQQGYDLLDKKMTEGTWMENVFEFDAGLPALGVRELPDGKKIEPAVPGMILTIDHQNPHDSVIKGNTFARLYAPNAPHTISKEVRSCASCHSDPSTLGFGKGSLDYIVGEKSGFWRFEPAYELNPFDSLPEDAWIPFLKKYHVEKISTRTNFRPFNLEEQRLLLTVGACLKCHHEGSRIMTESLQTGLNPLLLKLSDTCILPEF